MAVSHRDEQAYPHNLIVELLAELGPIVGSVILMTWGVASVRWWRACTRVGTGLGSLIQALVLFWGVAAMFSGDLTDSRMLGLGLALMAGLACQASQSQATAAVGGVPPQAT